MVAVPEHVLGRVRAGTAADVAQRANREADVAAAGVLAVLEPEILVPLDHVGDDGVEVDVEDVHAAILPGQLGHLQAHLPVEQER